MITKDLSSEQIEVLVKKSQKGSESAFSELYDYFFPKIFRYVSFKVNEIDRDDIVSEVFLKTIKGLSKYTHKEGFKFSSWLFRLANNTVIDFYRKKSRWAEIPEGTMGSNNEDHYASILDNIKSSEKNPKDLFIEKESFDSILGVIKKLPPVQEEVLRLKFLEDFSNREIAQITGKSEGNIRIIQLRALKALRQQMVV